MTDELQLISDGDGLAVIGEPTAVQRFLAFEGLDSNARELPRMSTILRTGGATAQAGSEVAANSGRWVKLTEESAEAVKKYGLRKSSKSGLKTGVVEGSKGQVKGFVEFAKGPGSVLTNPALLAGAAGVMAQVAMQQTMDEITTYLATIDAKLDDVLRAQKDTVLARLIGVGFVIEEAMTIHERRGRVDEITWSKVQTVPATIAETQAYALRQLDALAEKIERQTKLGDLATASEETELKTQEWLAVLARCFQLQDGLAVLELDRVLDASPDEVDDHRLGIRAARQDRLGLISQCTQRLLDRVQAAADTANTKVLLHPSKAPAVVRSSNQVVGAVADFQERLGLEPGRDSLEARQWASAVTEVRDRALESGADRVSAVRRHGSSTFDRARSSTGKLSDRITEHRPRWRKDNKEPED